MKISRRRRWLIVGLLAAALVGAGVYLSRRHKLHEVITAIVEYHFEKGLSPDAPRIIAVRRSYPMWVFKVAKGPLSNETVIGYGEINERTLATTFVGGAGARMPREFGRGKSVSIPTVLWRDPQKRPYSADEIKQRRANVKPIQDALADTAWYGDIRGELTPETSSPPARILWQLGVKKGWVTPEEPPAAIGIENLAPFDRELDFLSYWLQTYGSIDVETLSIRTWLID